MAKEKPLQRSVNFNLGARRVSVPVPDDIKAYFNEQYVRENPTPLFRKRYSTLQNLMRLAYLKGAEDAAIGKATDSH